MLSVVCVCSFDSVMHTEEVHSKVPADQAAQNVVNPRCACAARVTVVGSLCVCVCVCPLLNISPLERSVPHTQRAAKVRYLCGFL